MSINTGKDEDNSPPLRGAKTTGYEDNSPGEDEDDSPPLRGAKTTGEESMTRELAAKGFGIVGDSMMYIDPGLIGLVVEVVGTTENQRGRFCTKHHTCGLALHVGCYVTFQTERFAWRDEGIEDVLVVHAMLGAGKNVALGICPNTWR